MFKNLTTRASTLIWYFYSPSEMDFISSYQKHIDFVFLKSQVKLEENGLEMDVKSNQQRITQAYLRKICMLVTLSLKIITQDSYNLTTILLSKKSNDGTKGTFQK